MKIDEAKSIPLEQFLSKLGYESVRNQRGQLWYLSPLRQEKTPSFKVNTELNLWFDFGAGEGGTIIDLALTFGNHTSIPEALKWIESTMGGEVYRFEPKPSSPRPKAEPKHDVLMLGSLKNPDLKRYLILRGIDLRKCRSELHEVHYVADSRSYVAIGFASDRGGYELRSRSFKGALGSKSISTRSGTDAKSAVVFEGFFDYLTYLTLWGKPSGQVIVLNSVSFRNQAVEHLKKTNVSRIELYRDHDAAGEALFAFFREQLPSVEIIDQALQIYPDNKDLNDWHQANCRRQFRRAL